LADVSGTTITQAAGVLDTATKLEVLPHTEAAVRTGALSAAQASAITDAATADPNAERALIERAAVDGLRGLRDECSRVKAAARTDEMAHHRRIHNQRALKAFTDADGAGRIEIRGPVDATARIMAALEPFEREQFELVRTSGERERADAIAFDALVAMAERSNTEPRGVDGAEVAIRAAKQASTVAINVRVDRAALLRGHTEPGEVCEIVGAGPIPVGVARQLLDDCALRLLVVDGDDVLAVVHPGRTIPSRLRTAIEERQRECGIEGCNVTHHLEIDHNVPIEAGGTTELTNLNRLCRFHHRHKHEHDLRLVGAGTSLHFVPTERGPPTRSRQ
jgi:hypothetical protein